MTLYEILRGKGSVVFTIRPDATLEDAVRELVRRNVGCLVVCDRGLEEGERPVGVLSERDILHFCASGKGPLSDFTVSEAMTRQLIIGSPQDSVETAMGLMTTHRVRHMPVLVEGRMIGIVSIGDIVKYQHDRLAMENQFIKSYMSG